MTEQAELSAAVVDLRLGKGDGVSVFQWLHHLGIPFVVHTGYWQRTFASVFRMLP